MINAEGEFIDTVECPIKGLDDSFPVKVFLAQHPKTKKYIMYTYKKRARDKGICGIACFTTKEYAAAWSDAQDMEGLIYPEMTLDAALDIAKTRAAPVISLMLCDDPDKPRVQYVR